MKKSVEKQQNHTQILSIPACYKCNACGNIFQILQNATVVVCPKCNNNACERHLRLMIDVYDDTDYKGVKKAIEIFSNKELLSDEASKAFVNSLKMENIFDLEDDYGLEGWEYIDFIKRLLYRNYGAAPFKMGDLDIQAAKRELKKYNDDKPFREGFGEINLNAAKIELRKDSELTKLILSKLGKSKKQIGTITDKELVKVFNSLINGKLCEKVDGKALQMDNHTRHLLSRINKKINIGRNVRVLNKTILSLCLPATFYGVQYINNFILDYMGVTKDNLSSITEEKLTEAFNAMLHQHPYNVNELNKLQIHEKIKKILRLFYKRLEVSKGYDLDEIMYRILAKAVLAKEYPITMRRYNYRTKPAPREYRNKFWYEQSLKEDKPNEIIEKTYNKMPEAVNIMIIDRMNQLKYFGKKTASYSEANEIIKNGLGDVNSINPEHLRVLPIDINCEDMSGIFNAGESIDSSEVSAISDDQMNKVFYEMVAMNNLNTIVPESIQNKKVKELLRTYDITASNAIGSKLGLLNKKVLTQLYNHFIKKHYHSIYNEGRKCPPWIREKIKSGIRNYKHSM